MVAVHRHDMQVGMRNPKPSHRQAHPARLQFPAHHARDSLRHKQNMRGILVRHIAELVDMRPGDDHQCPRRNGPPVEKSDAPFILVDDMRRRCVRYDAAEDASVAHISFR